MTHSRLMSAALAMVVAGAAACAGGDMAVFPNGGNANAAGASFILVTVNDQTLPAETRHDASGSASVVSGTLVITATTFDQLLTLSETTAAGQTSTRQSASHGAITIKGNQIHFVASDGGQWDATYSVTRIEYSVSGNSGPITFVFVRNG